MAIGYQLLGKPVEGLDTSVFTTLSANLLAQEKERETQRQAWKTEQDALRKTQRDITATANQDANQFFGKFSQGIIDQSLDLQNQLETGQIRSSDYTAQWSNLNQSNEQMISAQKGYQAKAQKVVESVANQTASVGLAHNFAEFNKRFQPGKMSVEKDERGGLRLYNLETGQEVSPSYLNDLVNTELPKFDYTTAATTLVDSFGKRAFTAADGSFISGAIFNPGDTYSDILSSLNPKDIEKLMKTEAESILAGSQAPTVSILLDGKGYETVYNRSELKKGENIYRKPDGTYEFADGDEEVAKDFMAEQLRNALPLEKKERQELTVVQEETLNNVKPPDNTKIKVEKNKVKEVGYLQTINNAFTGNQKISRGAIDAMITKYNRDKSASNPRIVDLVRSKDGKTMTIIKIDQNNIRSEVPIDIQDPNVAAETFVNLVYGEDIDSSYKQILDEYSTREGGFTPEFLYTKNDKGEEVKVINPEYGDNGTINVEIGRTKSLPQPVNFATDKFDPTNPKGDTVSEIFTATNKPKEVNSIISNLINRRAPKALAGFTIINPDDPDTFNGPDLFVIKIGDDEITLGKTDDVITTQNSLQNLFNGKTVDGYLIEDGKLKKQAE